MRRYPKVRFAAFLSVLLVGLLAAGVAADQHESEPADEPIQLQELVVVGVGTRGQGRTVTDSPVPVDVVTEQEIVETGEAEVGRIIQALIPSFNFSSSTISDGTDSVRPATLRGLGPDQVLVLVNGKRRHGSALIHVNTSVGRGTAGTDLNAIPVSAIKRIEVLRDGASAQYGSDAIAGVINIVLKDSYDGALRTSAGQTYESDGTRYTARVNKGFRVGEDGVLHAALEFSHRGPTNRAGLSGSKQYSDSVIDGNNVLTMDPGNKERNFNRRNFRIGDAELDQFSGAFNYSNPIDGTGAEVYVFGDFSGLENESSGFYRRANQLDRNPLTSIYPDGFLPIIHTTVFDFSVGAGIVSEFENSLRADVAVVHGGNSFNFEVTNSHNASWVAQNCSSRATCSAQTSADAGVLSLDLTTINVDFTLPLRDTLHLAWGLEHRLDRYRIEAGEEYSYSDYDGVGGAAGGIQVFPGFKPENEVDELRNAFSLYVDTEYYVSDTFLISPAVRVENYSDFGSTINGKVAAKVDLSADFALRGSVSTGFRAPSMQQLYFNNISTQFRNVDGEQVAFEVGTFRNDSDLAKAIGIPELDAETSVTGSVGFVYQPLPEFTLTTDFYHIDVSDRIIISNQFDADTEGIPESVQRRIREAGGDRGQFFMNAADTRTQGVDVVATWDVPFVTTGDLGLKLLATVSETEITSINLPAGLPDALFTEQDRSIVEEWQPSYRLTLSGSYALDRFSAALALHGYGPYTVLDGERQEYSAKYLTDLRLGYSLGFGRLSIGANNLFNVTPDENEVGQSRGGRIIASDGSVIVDSPGVFTYSRRSAPFGFNGGFYYLAFDVDF
ncbi:MAG: TonB-dependent receptor [Candidatus Tectomicrobia bacterium]|nr:TonB-dependent receptor [Candidatus Tectomicrobia bacterium]